ncbi:helix-turn-helix transcriptional regulator [Caldivirga sp. UBA161]|uniref:helix-turn-helix transcriptional regulator n=1 Tax=Caldivirga sp. UBA161 TaxID=1915569 RepID=UPI0025C1606A|nr:winged helix-turn-helix transcriptional regulator [Caldivirga sp. UBA161]
MVIGLLLLVLFKAGGVPFVNYTIYIPQNTTIINVTLPVVPIPDTIEAINDSTGSLVPISLYPGNILSIFAFGGGYISIVYYGNYTFNAKSLLYSFNIESAENIMIVFPPFIIPFNLPISIIHYSVVNGSTLIVVLQPGNYTIQYTYVPRSLLTATSTISTSTTSTTTTTSTSTATAVVGTTTSTTTSASSTTSATSTSTTTQIAISSSSSITTTTTTVTAASSQQSISQSTAPVTRSNVTPLYIVVAVILIVVVSVVVFMSRRRALEAFEQYNLDEVDKLIISTLRQYGGSLYQSQLQQLTNIPKTTLWRHVMKLKDMGIVRVDKVNGLNKVTLISG